MAIQLILDSYIKFFKSLPNDKLKKKDKKKKNTKKIKKDLIFFKLICSLLHQIGSIQTIKKRITDQDTFDKM